MRRARLVILTTLLTTAMLLALGLPAFVVADPGPASPILRTTVASAAAVVSVVAADVRQAALTAQAAQAAQVSIAARPKSPVVAARTAVRTEPGAKTPGTAVKRTASPASASTRGTESQQAQAILNSLKAQYPRYLSGVTVSIGNASGYQAVAYYTSGRIVISPSHKASLSRILNHEVWHIIDWRDNGRIDWRESVPPANASSFR
jgi:hypothetical protein